MNKENGSIIKAIIISNIFMLLGSIVVGSLLGIVHRAYLEKIGLSGIELDIALKNVFIVTTPIGLISLLVSSMISMIGGYLCARIYKKPAYLLVVINGIVISVFTYSLIKIRNPIFVEAIQVFISFAALLFGVFIYEKSKHSSGKLADLLSGRKTLIKKSSSKNVSEFIEYQFASFLKRIFAALVDLVMFLPLIIISSILYSGSPYFSILNAAIPGFIIVSYFVLSNTIYGRTFGKRLFKIKIICLDNEKISLIQSLSRYSIEILLYLYNLYLIIDIGYPFEREIIVNSPKLIESRMLNILWITVCMLVILFNRHKRSIHDLFGNTFVVDLDKKKIDPFEFKPLIKDL